MPELTENLNRQMSLEVGEGGGGRGEGGGGSQPRHDRPPLPSPGGRHGC